MPAANEEFAKLAALIWTSAKLSSLRKWGKPRHTNPLINMKGYFGERISYMFPMLSWPAEEATRTNG